MLENKFVAKKIAFIGGHHSSALPVINLLLHERDKYKIIWFGHKSSLAGDKNETLEYKDITSLNIPFYDVSAAKVYGGFSVGKFIQAIKSIASAYKILKHEKPDIIVSFGGYIAVPVVVAGWVLNIPSITHEQTVIAGYANRIISLFCEKVMISSDTSRRYFQESKTILTGLPVRKEIFRAETNHFPVNTSLPTIYITGGKTGSHKINSVVSDCLVNLLNMCNVIHQSGDYSETRDYEMLTEKYKSISSKPSGIYHLRKFILNDEIGEVFHKSDVVVSRSGAHIVAELLVLKKKCLLIPIPWVSHNEQFLNASRLVEAELGIILSQEDLSVQTLLDKLKDLLSVPTEVSNHTEIQDTASKNIILIIKQILFAHAHSN